jgi:hypothetical protein
MDADDLLDMAELDEELCRVGRDDASRPQAGDGNGRQIVAVRFSHGKLGTSGAAESATGAPLPTMATSGAVRRFGVCSGLRRGGKNPGTLGDFAYCSEFRSKTEREPISIFDIFAQNLSDFLELPQSADGVPEHAETPTRG